MTASPRHSVSVAAAVVRDDSRILAVRRRDNGRWEPPGGILDLDETIEEGVTREVSEETGLLIGVDHPTGVYKNMTHSIIALVCHCHVICGTLHPTPEASAAAWLTPNEVRERMNLAFAIRLLDAIEDHTLGPRSPHTRRQGSARRSEGSILMDDHLPGAGDPSPARRQAGLLRGVAGSSCIKTPSDLRVELVCDGPRGAARMLRMTTRVAPFRFRATDKRRTNDQEAGSARWQPAPDLRLLGRGGGI